MRRTGILQYLRRSSLLVAFALAGIIVAQPAAADWGVPDGITDQARDTHNLYVFVLAAAAVVFLAVEGALVWAILRYRRRPGDEDTLPPQTHGSNVIEIIWTGIPVAIVIPLHLLVHRLHRYHRRCRGR